MFLAGLGVSGGCHLKLKSLRQHALQRQRDGVESADALSGGEVPLSTQHIGELLRCELRAAAGDDLGAFNKFSSV